MRPILFLFLVFLIPFYSLGQTHSLKGKVVDARNNEGIASVSIRLIDTQINEGVRKVETPFFVC